MAKGRKTGGRRPGSVNKISLAIKLAPLIAKAESVQQQILDMTLACSVCRGKGKTEFQPKGDNAAPGVRRCQSCWGSGKEKITPELRARVASELMEYGHAKRKAIKVTGPEGGPMEHKLEIVLVK